VMSGSAYTSPANVEEDNTQEHQIARDKQEDVMQQQL
jgi:hypothetical protein